MGRAFEFRKARKMKRWGQMAKTFTKLGKEIAISVKLSGPNPESNSRLRAAIQNAKAANMPKDNVERAIKKASSKDQEDYKEIVYEGYGPYGIAILVECATDNPTRTVANVRSYLTKSGGSLGTSGMLDFIFERKCMFRIAADPSIVIEEFEFEMIDHGVDEVFLDEESNEIVIYGEFTSFGAIQKVLEGKKIEIKRAEFERIPSDTKELNEEQAEEIEKLLGKFDEDDDVLNVFHNMR
jgi:YebC/PmpR family DNA-binding regulatory protein